MKLIAINELGAALILFLALAGCDGSGPTTDVDRASPQALQPNANALVEPHRYVRLSDLARAIRSTGHGCATVRTYKLIEQKDVGNSVYKIDCLEYSFRLTIINGQGRIERWASRVDERQKSY